MGHIKDPVRIDVMLDYTGSRRSCTVNVEAWLCDPESDNYAATTQIGSMTAILANSTEALVAAADEVDTSTCLTAETVHEQMDRISRYLGVTTGSHLLVYNARIVKRYRSCGLGLGMLDTLESVTSIGRHDMLITLFPAPTKEPVGMTRKEAATKLVAHWGLQGFKPVLDIQQNLAGGDGKSPLVFLHTSLISMPEPEEPA